MTQFPTKYFTLTNDTVGCSTLISLGSFTLPPPSATFPRYDQEKNEYANEYANEQVALIEQLTLISRIVQKSNSVSKKKVKTPQDFDSAFGSKSKCGSPDVGPIRATLFFCFLFYNFFFLLFFFYLLSSLLFFLRVAFFFCFSLALMSIHSIIIRSWMARISIRCGLLLFKSPTAIVISQAIESALSLTGITVT